MADPTTSTPFGADATQTDEGLMSSRPPATSVPVRTWVVDSVRGLSDLRAQILVEVSPPGVEPVPDLDSTAHRMVLVASELATNALRHGIPPTVVALSRDRECYVLDVADGDLATRPYVAGARPPGQGGFGLQIARRLSVAVGWYTTATAKHVWARFPVPQ